MPKTTKSGKPKQDELPSTLQRSPHLYVLARALDLEPGDMSPVV
jgi:hypothetical protein